MMVWELTTDDVEAVVNLAKRGMARQEIAKSLGMTVHMVVCAERKATRGTARPNMSFSLMGIR